MKSAKGSCKKVKYREIKPVGDALKVTTQEILRFLQ
jgi:hypothetical protein